MIQLRFTGGPRVGQVVQLKTAIATAGRAPSCDIVVDDPMVSGIHASLELVAAGYIVTDQQSANGTLVNGQRIFRALLRIGDELVLGSTGLKVESSSGFAATMLGGNAQFRASPVAETMMPGQLQARSGVAATMMAGDGLVGPPILEVLGAMGQGVTTTPIPPGGIVLGRHPDCGCVLSDPQISSRHCKIVVGPEGPVLTDLGSSNGTFVNEQRLERESPVLMRDSDSVRIGALTLRVRAPRAAPVAQPAPVAPPPPEPPRWFVDVLAGAPAQRVEIRAGELFTIGRLPTSTIVLNDPQSSGQHAELVIQQMAGEPVAVLTDVGSRNGTFALASSGEVRLQPHVRRPMSPGDVVRIGSVNLRLSRVQKTPSVRAEPNVMSDLPVEPNLPKQVRGGKIVFIAGPRAGTAVEEVPLERVATRIGRASDNDISLEDPSVSARHCSVVAQERGFVLQDMGSTNGCFVNGERVTPNGERLLIPGDLVRVGLDSVFELRMEGAARKTFAQMSVVAEGGVVVVTPRFVIRGAVVKKPRATVGRDVACDVFIDDPAIARQAIELEFREDRFFARALAPGALVINKKTVGESELATGDVLNIGQWRLRMEVSGARLTIHEQMNPNGNASWAREAESSAQAPVALEGVVLNVGQAVFSTMFAADQSQLDKIVPKREKKKAAPKWKATSDLLADRNRSVPALIGLAAAAVILVVLFSGKGSATFLDGELARGHDSKRFQTMAKEHGLKDGCNSCHKPMAKISSERCQTCHPTFAPRQAIGAQRGHDHVSAKLACASCHEEHRGAQRGEALVAKSSCSKSGCHDAGNPPHKKLKPEPETAFIASVRMPAPQKVSMPAGDAKQAQEKLHAIHANVTHRCMACHSASDGKSQGNATGSCFRCHSGPGVSAAMVMIPTGGPKGGPGGGGGPPDDSACLGCHAMHDQTLARAGSDEALGARWTGGVSSKKSGGAAALAVAALFLLAGGFATVYFKSRVDHVARLALEEPGETKAKGSPEKAADGEVERKNDHAGVKLKVNVNKDKCVGCACCVNACPTAVLEIVSHKSTVTNEASCTSCRECEKVCPSGALTMAPEGAPPRLIDMPDLDSHYQTSVPGLYLIGEAAGKSLVKNACNLGKVVVDHMVATGLRPGDAARLGADVEVLSVGSGPGGLSAAVTAKKHGLAFAVIEKDRVRASTIQYCPKGKEFLAEPFDVKNISHLPIVDTTKEKLLELWDEILRKEGMEIRLGEEVLDLKKEGEVFVVTTSKGITKALKVVLSPGTRGSPRKLGVPGQELEKVSYMLVDPAEHQSHHVMVVGGGDSAVECAMSLAGQPGNVVTLSYRKSEFARIKPRNLERINQHAAEGKVKLIFNSVPHEVRSDCVVLKIDKETVEVKNQFIYCLLGADLPMVWLQQLGVRYVKKPEGWNPGPTDAIVVKPLEVAA